MIPVMELDVREMVLKDIDLLLKYWFDASPEFLIGMGATPEKLPQPFTWKALFHKEYSKPIQDRSFCYTVWFVDSEAVGHCNINEITFKEQAFMHIHLWNSTNRKKGLGA